MAGIATLEHLDTDPANRNRTELGAGNRRMGLDSS